MATNTANNTGPDGRSYRISELVEASGVSRDMIKYFLRAKLLPKPDKPRANLSLYTRQHLLLIRLILRFQQQTKLSLPEISAVFSAAHYDPGTIEIELLSDKYASPGQADNIIPFVASAQGAGNLSFPPEFIDELVNGGLLPQTTALDKHQEQIAGLLWTARNDGVPIAFFQAAQKRLGELAEIEVQALLAIARPGQDFNAAVESITSIDRVINRWMICEKSSQARTLFQRVIDNSEAALSSIHDTIYRPSPVFRQRFAVEEGLSELCHRMSDTACAIDDLHQACVACLVLTDFDRAIALADAALERVPGDNLAIALKSLCYGMQNDLDNALGYARQLDANSRHPLVMQARLLALLMRAAKLGGVANTTDILKQAGELFRDLPPVTSHAPLEACLLLGRAHSLFPDALNRAPEAIAALESVLERVENHSYSTLALPLESIRVVYRIYACYYLGLIHDARGEHTRARPYFEQVIQLDPASNFGEVAYLKMA